MTEPETAADSRPVVADDLARAGFVDAVEVGRAATESHSGVAATSASWPPPAT